MEETNTLLVKRLLQEGKVKEDIRREFISQGLSTEGFEETYQKYVKELGIKPESPVVHPVFDQAYSFGPAAMDSEKPYQSTGAFLKEVRRGVSLFWVFAVLVIVGLCVVVLWYFLTFQTSGGSVLNDDLIKSKVESTVASARIQGGRMGGYDGVCKDISVVDPVLCSGTPSAFAIYAPLSGGTFYCSDSTGFKGEIAHTPERGAVVCNQN